MAMIDIEYRYSGKDASDPESRRPTTYSMEQYMRDLVSEMQEAEISAGFYTGFAVEGERNMVYINGRSVTEILDGLKIVIPEADEDTCGCNGPKIVTVGRPMLDWNRDCIEDIPDVLMKNAISKVYSTMEADRIM